MDCLIYAVFLPNLNKKYVLEEIFSYIRAKKKDAKIFIGVQYNSIPETEAVLAEIKGDLSIEMERVPAHLVIDSDASSFIAALKAYSRSDMNFDKCYFIHSKGITSNNDGLRKMMYDEIFDDDTIDKHFADPEVGSYGPYLTLTDVKVDIGKMSSFAKFNSAVLNKKVMEYYYINTFFVIKNHILKRFIETVSSEFFNTNLNTISDRWFFERDFSHVADMQGYKPSFKHFHGNYSTHYKMPTMPQYEAKLNKWRLDNGR